MGGKRTIRYLDPADEEKPKLQRPTVFFDRPLSLGRDMSLRIGGRILVDQLELHGVDLAFGVPGESYLAVLDALVDSPIRYITTRDEVGAANMAEAYGKLTGRPGICLVTRGPGATHASGGIHTAFQDSTPLLLLIGQVARGDMERDAFQEIDYRQMFGPMAKWVAQIDDAAGSPSSSRERSTSPLRAGRGRLCWRCPRTCSSTRSTSWTPPVRARSGGSDRGRSEADS